MGQPIPLETHKDFRYILGCSWYGCPVNEKGALSFGVNPTAGDYSTAIGYGPTSSGTYSTAIGVNTSSAGSYASAIGYTATSAGSYSLSLGMGAQSDSSYSTAVGYYSKALGNKSLAIGSQYSYTYLRLRINKFTGEIEWYPVTVKYNTATYATSRWPSVMATRPRMVVRQLVPITAPFLLVR
ncbi:MAG: hypothetical protein U0X39_02170 [Bacteroidales bacterium]